MKTGFSLRTFSHREIPVMKTGSLQWEQGSPVMKTGFSLWEKVHRENPVPALYWPCRGLQCIQGRKLFKGGNYMGKYSIPMYYFLTRCSLLKLQKGTNRLFPKSNQSKPMTIKMTYILPLVYFLSLYHLS